MNVLIEVSPGELCDKVTILRIKEEKIEDPTKLANIQKELDILYKRYDQLCNKQPIEITEQIEVISEELKIVNEEIWAYEDTVRDCEREKTFEDGFLAAARGIYKANDKRAQLKRKINDLLNSEIVEEKSYTEYE